MSSNLSQEDSSRITQGMRQGSRWNDLYYNCKSIVNIACEYDHGNGLVAMQQQRQMPVVDDDQRRKSTLWENQYFYISCDYTPLL